MRKRFQFLNGYRLIYEPEHHRAMEGSGLKGYVYEHIICAERMLGRKLLKNEVVHHLNSNRSDNRYSNLLVLTASQHAKLHTWLDGKHNSDKTEIRFCKFCGITLPTNKHKKYCSTECNLAVRNLNSNIPPKETLKKDIDNMSFLAIGRKYRVSDNAVRKWARKYDLI